MGCCCSKPTIKETYTSGSTATAIIINPKDYYKFPQIDSGYGYTINEKTQQYDNRVVI